MEDFTCALCLRLLLLPVTISCGHTFCKACIKRSLRQQRLCPMCRTSVTLPPSALAPNVIIQSLISKGFAEELAARQEEEQADEVVELTRLPVMIV